MAEIKGTQGDDILDGTDGADVLRGRAGDDKLTCGAGDDRGQGGKGNDKIFGQDGNDKLVGAGGDDLLDGRDGDDNLNGGPGDDELDGGVGADRLVARGGSDFADGGEGDDTILGGSGADELLGRAGNDRIKGGRGQDLLNGGDGDDELDGGAGHDDLTGRDGNDIMSGGGGNDTMQGHAGDDVMRGGAGNDFLDGSLDNDVLDGGADDDTLEGGSGNDVLTGGPGNDILRGGSDDDTATFSGAFSEYRLTIDGGDVTVEDRQPEQTGDPTIDCQLPKAECDDGTDTLQQIEFLRFFDRTTNADASNAFPMVAADFAISVPRNSVAADVGIPEPVDPDGDPLGVLILAVPDPAIGSLLRLDNTVLMQGASVSTGELIRLRFEPQAGASGDAGLLSFRVDDGRGGTAEQNISFEVIAPPPGVVDLGNLVAREGFSLVGAAKDDEAGIAVDGAGDVNGDGLDDIIIGARGADPGGVDRAGESYVVYGVPEGGTRQIALANLDGGDGFALPGDAAVDRSGIAVAGLGDVNGDQLSDVLVGAPRSDLGGDLSGAAYMVLGPPGAPARIELDRLKGSDGFVVIGDEVGALAGGAVTGINDFNGDGLNDFAIGAAEAVGIDGPDPDGDPLTDDGGLEGQTYVVFGTAAGYPAEMTTTDLDGAAGFRLFGVRPRDRSGSSVDGGCDVNGDGFADLLIGAPFSDASGSSSGAAYVVFGSTSAAGNGSVELDALGGEFGFRVRGGVVGDGAGADVACLGDVNGDGFDDFAVAAPDASPVGTEPGEVAVVFGGSGVGASGDLALSNLDGGNGFVVRGAASFDRAGHSVSSGGDFDGDGLADLLIGAPGADANGENSGTAYLVFGRSDGRALIDLFTATPDDVLQLRGQNPGDQAGISVANAGDVNGDGFSDALVGANLAEPGAQRAAGTSYVVFGSDVRGLGAIVGTADNDVLTGTAAAESILGGRGNDTLSSGGGSDVLRGGAGDDELILDGPTLRLADGGSGFDVLRIGPSSDAVVLNLAASPPAALHAVESIDLGGSGSTLILDKLAVQALPSHGSRVLISGTEADEVRLNDSGWALDGNEAIGDQTFDRYVNGPAEVLILQEMGPPFPFEFFRAEQRTESPVGAQQPAAVGLDLFMATVLVSTLVLRAFRRRFSLETTRS